ATEIVVHAESAAAAPGLAIGDQAAAVGELGVAAGVAEAAVELAVRPEGQAVDRVVAVDAVESGQYRLFLARGTVRLDLDGDDVGRLGNPDLVADDRESLRRIDVESFVEDPGRVALARALGIFEHDDAIAGLAQRLEVVRWLRRLRAGGAAIVHAFGHP